jgi:hypothetical protein
VATTVAEDALARGYEALAAGAWDEARDAFREALDLTDSPEALDGLGRALWWLRDERGAVVHRERAYAGFRRDGELARAARIALWLAREYGLAFDNDAAARGWLAQASSLGVGCGSSLPGLPMQPAPRQMCSRESRPMPTVCSGARLAHVTAPPRAPWSPMVQNRFRLDVKNAAILGLPIAICYQGPATSLDPFQRQMRDRLPPLGRQRESPRR